MILMREVESAGTMRRFQTLVKQPSDITSPGQLDEKLQFKFGTSWTCPFEKST